MALTQIQLNALNGINDMTPDQSSTALGAANAHSQTLFGGSTGAFNEQGVQTAKQQIGGALPTVGAIGGGIAGATGGALVGGPVGAYAGGVAGATAGGALGESANEALTGQKQQPGQIAKQGAIMGAFEAVGGPVLSGLGKVFGGVAEKAGAMFGGKAVADTVEKVVAPPVKVATNRLASTAETLTKGEREAAIKEGRMTDSGKYLPSKTEQRAGEIMQGKTYSNPVKTTKAIQGEISTRGQAAETHLEKNVKPISNKEDFDAFQKARASSEKYMTPAEATAYDEQVGVFQKVLKSYTGDGGYTTANYYKALKDYESQVTANLAKGKDALLTPGGAARIQGAKDVRQVVRDMIGKKNPEFKGEMYDLASLYGSLDNVVSKAEQGGHSLAKRYPRTTAALGTGAAVAGFESRKSIPIIGDMLP